MQTEPLALHYLHLDFETAGFDELLHDIVDVGIIGTDVNHKILFTYTSLVHATARTLAAIAENPFVLDMMQKNGLLTRLIAGSTEGSLPGIAEIEDDLLTILDEHGIDGTSVKITLAGSGVATFDMRFIRANMPRLLARLNYWTADVGVLRREWKTATGTDLVTVNKDKPHTGIDDVQIHRSEAMIYREIISRIAAVAGGGDLASIEAFLSAAERQRAEAERFQLSAATRQSA